MASPKSCRACMMIRLNRCISSISVKWMETGCMKLSVDFPRRNLLLLGAACVLSLGIYLIASALYLHPGFPLDDSWIHLTYARNLAQYGEWAFLPGEPSAGSTAPLWSAMLSIGFLFHLAPYFWTYLLGAIMLFVLSTFM